MTTDCPESGQIVEIGIAYNANKNGMSVRCVVTDVNGKKATSNAAVLTYK